MGIDGPAALIDVPAAAATLGRAFAAAGHELHLVGGTVRDALMGRISSDLDFTTDARPEQILAVVEPLASAVWTTGIEFGTVGAQVGGAMCEVTTFRADRYDRVSRNPIVRFGDSLTDDLRRRDFTMNAMALCVSEGDGERTFTDPYGGLADLVKLVLRTPAAPEESFADDPLRMLRAARFVATLGVGIETGTFQAMKDLAPQLSRITAERVQAELSKLLLGADPREGIEVLVETGLAEIVLPEIPALRMAADEHGQHKDVYAHTLQVLEQAIDLEDDGPDLTLRLAALLHDIGKPATRAFLPGGRVSFHHHEVVGRKMAAKRLKALRYSKQMIEDVSRLVFLHLRFYGYRDGEWQDSAVRRYVVDAGPLLPRLHKLVRSDCTTRNKRKAAALSGAYDELEHRIAALQEQEQLDAVRPDLDGNDIMRILGIGPGREVGQAWAFLKELRMEHGPLGPERATEELTRWWASRQADSPTTPGD